jgi:long-chain fatty acid transport protein
MTSTFLKISVSALALSVMAGSALAGGYGRGSANIDTLFEEGTYTSSSMAVTSPTRSVATRNGIATSAAQGKEFAETYSNFGASVAFDVVGGVRCAGTFAQPYGADADYGTSRLALGASQTTSSSLGSSEFGATCSYSMEVGPGKAYFIGGIYNQNLDYNEIRGFGAATINMTDSGIGYRLGVGYTIPEVALKASLIYRSGVEHRMTGEQFIAAGPAAGTYNIYADASLPQSTKLSLQSGVAEGWLVFGSVEWTDWSSIQAINVKCAQGYAGLCAAGGNSPGNPSVDAYFSDGWNVNVGVGHKFNDMFSGSFSVSWDKGVSENFLGAKRSSFTDTWTFAVGGAFNPNPNASVRAGLAYSILTSGTEQGLAAGAPVLGYKTQDAITGGVSANFKF